MIDITIKQNHSQIDITANEIRDDLIAKGETLESMLAVLREERERYDGASFEIDTPGDCLAWYRERWR